jgi:signal transduction histidine kinase
MNKKKRIALPFLLIVGFSIIVMLAVFIAQYHSQNGIRQLQNGNAQALIAVEIDNLLDDIINEIYIIEEETKTSVSSVNKDTYQQIEKALEKLKKENDFIEQLQINDDSSKQIIQQLHSLVIQKMEPLGLLQPGISPSMKTNIFNKITSDQSRQLTDSIYVTALKIQQALEKNLQNTFIKNKSLSARVLSFSNILGILSIASIAILASIIIHRLVQNTELIKALENAKIQAEKVSDIKEQFLANMSHEIRTPVNSVLGFTNLLQETKLNEQQEQFVSLIKTSGQNLLGIINDILDISKIESGLFQFDRNPFNLRELCYSIEMLFYHQLLEKELLFECVIHEDVPEIIIGDKERLTQIFINLLSNAIKFTNEGEIKIYVELINKKENSTRIQFIVKDTGIGIKPDKLDSIFERFEQAEAGTTRNYGGTGLGLSIVKNLVTLQGGSILAKSVYGQGTSFTFEIEFGLEKAGYSEYKPALPNRFSPTGEIKLLNGIKVLAAEDNKMNQKLLDYYLKKWGVDVEYAETGNQCIEKFTNHSFDMVLMDIQMPEMDGYKWSRLGRLYVP